MPENEIRFIANDGGRSVDLPTATSFLKGVRFLDPVQRLQPSDWRTGTAVHEAITHALLLGQHREANPAIPEAWNGYTRGAIAFLHHTSATPLGVEVPVFTPGHYGGFIDCVAINSDGRATAIDWKTGGPGYGPVQLAAYVNATRYFGFAGSAQIPGGPLAASTSRPLSIRAFWECWLVLLGEDRWAAYGFNPNDNPTPPAIAIYERLYRLNDRPRGAIQMGNWWQWQLGPFDTPLPLHEHAAPFGLDDANSNSPPEISPIAITTPQPPVSRSRRRTEAVRKRKTATRARGVSKAALGCLFRTAAVLALLLIVLTLLYEGCNFALERL